MNPNANPSMMLPGSAVASMIRSGGTPGQIFQQNPLSQNMNPGAMGADPSLMQQPPVGSQAMNPTMPPPMPPPQQGMQQPNAGVPGQQPQPMDEATMILQALSDRLAHHSKITQKTVNTLTNMIEANQPVTQPPQT